MIKEYLQLTRFHTAPLEALPAAIGASLAVGELLHISVLVWGIYGILYHITGYGQNSYTDWKSGYDKKDPNKQHFPLNRGTLSPTHAKWTVIGLVIITWTYAIIFIWGNWIPFIVLLTGVLAGVGYNLIGKEIGWKSLLISYAHSTVFTVPYLASGGTLSDPLLYLGGIYLFLMIIYQISIEGEVKDMNTDEENFLLNRGAAYIFDMPGYDEFVGFPFWIRIYGHTIKFLTAGVGVLIAAELSASLYVQGAVAFVLIITSFVFGGMLLQSGEYNRQDRIKNMSFIEGFTLWGLLVAVSPVIGIIGTFGLFIGSMIWVLVFNKIEWNSWVAPDV